MALIHIKSDYNYNNITVQEIKKDEVLKVLAETNEDEQSYVVQDSIELDVLQDYDVDGIIDFLYDSDASGNLIAKYIPHTID